MANELPDYSTRVRAAVASYWDVRATQAKRSRDAGVVNTGLRAEVTGGRHLDALELLLVEVLVDAGIPASMLEVKRRPVPGYFRRDKSWDIVVTVKDRVLAIIELKSIVGDNPGQNFNNRTDEALGQAMDVWEAVERGIIDSPLRPWLGYFMLIEDNNAWNRPSQPRSAVWPADPVFDGASPAQRTGIFFDRMVRERLLDAACVLMASRTTADFRQISETLSSSRSQQRCTADAFSSGPRTPILTGSSDDRSKLSRRNQVNRSFNMCDVGVVTSLRTSWRRSIDATEISGIASLNQMEWSALGSWPRQEPSKH